LIDKANRVTASEFLTALIAAVPYKIHIVLTDNGIQFRLPPRYADGPTAQFVIHMFALRCRENGIQHRFTKVNHPWTHSQVEQLNRTIKEGRSSATTTTVMNNLSVISITSSALFNFGRRLKTLKGRTPYEFICQCWTSEPQRFTLNPLHQPSGTRHPLAIAVSCIRTD
jgi:transposase InsO family protein